MPIKINYSDIVQIMKNGGSFRLYQAKTETTNSSWLQALWAQIQEQRDSYQDHNSHCCILLKSPAKDEVTMNDIMDLCDLVQKNYSGEISWGYEFTNGNQFELEVIG